MNFIKTKLKGKWAIDTNLLIYALDKKSPYFKKTYQLFSLIKKGQILPVISAQNITEAVNVLSNIYKLPVKKTVQAIEELITSFNFKIINPLPSTIPLFFNLLKKAGRKKIIYDIFLAATLIDNKQFKLLTVNEKDFRNISKLKTINPFKK